MKRPPGKIDMPLSNKKLKYIQRHAGRTPPEEIARELRLPLAQVEALVEEMTGNKVSSASNKEFSLTYLALLALVFIAPYPIIHGLSDYTNLPKTAFIQIGALLLLSIWLWESYRTGSFRIVKCRLYLPLGTFILWSGLTLFWAKNACDGIPIWVHWLACSIIFFIALQTLNTGARIRHFMCLLMATATIASFVGILQYLLKLDWFDQNVPPAVTFGNKNMAAHFIVMSMPAGMAAFLSSRNRAQAWVAAFCLSLMTTFTVYSVTKAAWVVLTGESLFLVAYFVYARLRFKQKIVENDYKIPPAIAAICFTLLLIHLSPNGFRWKATEFYNRVSGIWSKPATEPATRSARLQRQSHYSARLRLIYYDYTLDMIQQHPFAGLGVNNFKVYYPEKAAELYSEYDDIGYILPLRVHNDYLQLILELGLLVVLFIFLALFYLIKAALRALNREQASDLRLYALVSLVAIAGFATNALFSFPTYLAIPPMLFALYTAILFRISLGDGSENPSQLSAGTYNIRPGFSFVGAVLASVVCAFWIYTQNRWIKADRLFYQQNQAIVSGDWDDAILLGKRVLMLNPLQIAALDRMGHAYVIKEKFEEARDALIKYHHANPYARSNLRNLAYSYYRLGDFEKSKNIYEQAIIVQPREAALYNFLGLVWNALGKGENALKEMRQAIELAPENSRYFFNLAIQAYRLGYYTEAADNFKRAATLNPKSAPARKWLGLTLFNNLDRKGEGITYLKEALELRPDMSDAVEIHNLITQYEAGVK